MFQKYPAKKLRFPCGLQESDFLNQLKLAFPQLAAEKSFDIFRTDQHRKLQPLKVNTLTPEEIYRTIRSTGVSALYIRLKVQRWYMKLVVIVDLCHVQVIVLYCLYLLPCFNLRDYIWFMNHINRKQVPVSGGSLTWETNYSLSLLRNSSTQRNTFSSRRRKMLLLLLLQFLHLPRIKPD